MTEGDTLAQARAMAEDAIRAFLESLRKDGLPIPADNFFLAWRKEICILRIESTVHSLLRVDFAKEDEKKKN